ncbi:MAG: ABC transporter ATP-binding protein [Thermoprotei archaeon]|nr:MAG: ABC transporter ATP-binding protein [Thermoprotei archaeon]
MQQKLLELKNVTKIYRVGGGLGLRARYITAVKNVTFSIPEGEPLIVALVGESGSGKTTIARMVLGLTDITSGEILYRGKSVAEWLKEDPFTFRKEVQAIFQDPYSAYNPFYRVERILYLAIKKFKLASSKEEAEEMIIKAMKALGLRPEDLLGRYPHQLSGGERQRLMLVRALLIKPRLLVADEPVSMIDASLRAVFLNNLLQLKKEINMSCLYITHDLNIANYVSDRMVVLCNGRVVEEGPSHMIFEEPLHPYTDLLVKAVPIPDPRRRWKSRISIKAETLREVRPERGCPFQHRCPHVTDRCRTQDPPIVDVGSGRKVACFLYT